MFTDTVTNTPFTTEDADYLFDDKIPRFSVLNDYSLLSTMRALIAPRMPEGRTLTFGYSTCDSVLDRIDLLIDTATASKPDAFRLINVSPLSPEKREAIMQFIQSSFVEANEGYEELASVKGFFAKSFPVLCFVNREIHSTVLVVSRLDLRKLHYIQTALLVMMPWYHGSRESVSENELSLIKSFRNNDSTEYRSCLKQLAEKYDFREPRIRRLMSGFETRADRSRMETTKNDITRIDNDIDQYNNLIAGLMRRRNELLLTLMGLEAKIASYADENSELMGYMLRNKRVTVCNVDYDQLTIMLTDYLEYYDEDLIERNLKNDMGAIYQSAPSAEAYEDMRKLMMKIFLDRELRIRVSAAYRITPGERVEGLRRGMYDGQLDASMPNPHVFQYSCLGQYNDVLTELVRDNDYIGIIDQCLASVRSLNWGDSPVMSYFASYMYHDEYRCIELPDGQIVYPSEAISWIKEQEKAELRAEELKMICFGEDCDDETEEEEDE